MIIHSIKQFITQNNLLENNQTIIIGLSGGPDSVFLLYLLEQLRKEFNLTLIAAHLDHEWRSNSKDDVLFCKTLCDKLEITFVAGKASQLSITLKKTGSQEETGRLLRRFFLEKVQTEYKANAIALGHHAQDHQETFFIRLIRGTSLSGLISMQPKAGLYIRPLLQTNKQDILNYLDENKITYLIDPTNESESYLRNRIRLKALPALSECDARFNQNFLKTITSLQETESYLQEITKNSFTAMATLNNETYEISVEKFLSLPKIMRYRVLMHWLIAQKVSVTPTQTFFDELVRFLLQKKSLSHSFNEKWALVKEGGLMYFKRIH